MVITSITEKGQGNLQDELQNKDEKERKISAINLESTIKGQETESVVCGSLTLAKLMYGKSSNHFKE